jgi:hypothetical protein
VEDIAHHTNLQTLDLPEVVPDGEHVQEALGRVLVTTVAGVDDVRRDPLRQKFGGA